MRALVLLGLNDEPDHSQLADEIHLLATEGRLALERFIAQLERKHESGFRVMEVLSLPADGIAKHRCELPALPEHTWIRLTCKHCGQKWRHRGNAWWPEEV